MESEALAPVYQLMAVNDAIAHREKELEALYVERDRLSWTLEQGDHTESEHGTE